MQSAVWLFLIIPSLVAAQSAISKDLTLSDWGFSDISEIGFLSMGVVHDKAEERLVIYDLRREKPLVPDPSEVKSRKPTLDGSTFVVSHFEEGNTNRLNGYFNTFSRPPSVVSLDIAKGSDQTSSLHFSYDNRDPGFAGFWIHLYDFKEPLVDQVFLDASSFKYLGFRIRGEKGGEPVILQVADRKWEKKGDSLPVDDLGSFLPSGKMTHEWQEAWVPLANFPQQIDQRFLASLVFRISSDHRGKIFLKDLVFSKDKKPIPAFETQAFSSPVPLQNAMWLWETTKLLGNREEQDTLARFCLAQDIRHLFIQIPYKAWFARKSWKVRWDTKAMRQLVSRLREDGIDVTALDGHPYYALAQNHGRVLALVQSLLDYNRNSTPSARMVGVRFDNEVYLLPNFNSLQKPAILQQYLDFVKKAQALAHAGGLEFGVDVPFWLDNRDEYNEPMAGLNGRPIIESVIDIVDNIGIMDYRTVAYGADGVIANGEDELAYAAKAGKKVFVGLETVWLPDETLVEFHKRLRARSGLAFEDLGGGKIRVVLNATRVGLSNFLPTRTVEIPSSKITFFAKTRNDLSSVMKNTQREYSKYSSFKGFAIHSYESYRPWIERQK